MRRFLALLVLAAIAAGLWYWKARPGAGHSLDDLGSVGQGLRDAALVGAVKTALGLNRSLRPYSIDVVSEDAVVTLRGDVGSDEARATAERLAGAVPDVRQVVSHLRVVKIAPPQEPAGRSLGESFDDHALEVQVRLAFSLHRELKGTDVVVQAFKRQVTLTGTVAKDAQRMLAERVAGETADVAGVNNELRVGTAATGPAKQVVEQALSASASLAGCRFEVREQSDGRLELTGRVRSAAEKELAGILAREAAGRAVENRLEVKP